MSKDDLGGLNLKDIMDAFDKSSIAELKLKNDDFSLKLSKVSKNTLTNISTPVIPAASALSAPEISIVDNKNDEQINTSQNQDNISSPMVGVFYRCPSPDSAPYVNVGDIVSKGQTVAIIEAMKIMNEIEAEFDCKIIQILAQDGEPVEYDSPMFIVEKV